MTDEPRDIPSDEDVETVESQPERPKGNMPKEIGHYKVRRVIGSGGMGTVYEAIQENPRRKVAIKVMRSGVTSRSAMRRFEYESQILGRLSHRCIAQVYEAGTYDDGTGGVPYFAMEYIIGAKTLLEYATQKDLKVHERLVLFEQVCDAVHHGHLKGIIHRDLKPDNILVDSSGNPKIIDFGVARATDSDMAVTTLQTNVGQLIGTVQYMSPEQCEADPDLIDARSDVYSLGVILYELLTGQPPYNLSSIPIYEATRLIREQQPTKMTTIAEGIGGDLETIVSKSMDKDRDRRYQSAYEIGQDITRFLENEPIHARRASMVYQLKMFARRNKAVVATVLAIGVALVIATTISVYAGILASQAEAKAIVDRDRAVAAEQAVASERDRAVTAEQTAKDALLKAESSRNRLEIAIKEIQESVIMIQSLAFFVEDLLSSGTPRNAQGKLLTTHDLATLATREITKRFGDIPHLEFPARRSIGELLWELGDLEAAKQELERSIEIGDSFGQGVRIAERLLTAYAYALVLRDLGEFEKAREVAVQVRTQGEAIAGSTFPLVTAAKDLIADIMEITMTGDSLELRQEVLLDIKDWTEFTPQEERIFDQREFELGARVALAGTLITMHGIVGATTITPELEEAEQILNEILQIAEAELGTLHPVTVQAKRFQTTLFYYTSRYDEALENSKEVLDDYLAVYGPNHIETAEAYGMLGFLRFMRGRNDEAMVNLGKAIAIYDQSAGKNSFAALSCQIWMANSLSNLGQPNQAELILTATLPLLEEIVGSEHPTVINARGSLAGALLGQGKFDRGDQLWQQTLDSIQSLPSDDLGMQVLNMRYLRAMAYIVNRRKEADETADSLMEDIASYWGVFNNETIGRFFHLAELYISNGRADRGLLFLAYWIDRLRQESPSESQMVLGLELELASRYLANDMPIEAEKILERIVNPLIESFGETNRLAVYGIIFQSRIMITQDRGDESTSILKVLREQLASELGEENQLTLEVEVALAKSYLAQDRWSDLDSLMSERLNRRQDNPELLIDMSNVIISNENDEYKERYLDIALQAIQRAVSIRGEDDSETTYVLANVYFARGEQDEALNWLAKTVAFAGEDDENIKEYREKLEEVTVQLKETVEE